MRFYGATLEEFQADVLRGERVTSRLLGRRPKYFRHPTLNTGRNRAVKAAFERFLDRNGYRIAPVSIHNDEYLYALGYDRARGEGDREAMARIATDYIRYMEEIFAFFEALSRDLLGREPAQILLLHANALNAENLGELATMVARRGYRSCRSTLPWRTPLTVSETTTSAGGDLPGSSAGLGRRGELSRPMARRRARRVHRRARPPAYAGFRALRQILGDRPEVDPRQTARGPDGEPRGGTDQSGMAAVHMPEPRPHTAPWCTRRAGTWCTCCA
ncbi:MAG: hypothetical protein ABR576_14265 [Thermoanaerobaculia bacterium]